MFNINLTIVNLYLTLTLHKSNMRMHMIVASKNELTC